MTDSQSTSKGKVSLLWRLARATGVAYLLVLLLLRTFENRLVYPAPSAAARWRDAEDLDKQEVQFQAADKVELHGWYAPSADSRGYLLYCHGNGENVSDQAELIAMLRETYRVSVFAFDYRGYGKSEGAPNETGVLADAEAAYQWLRNQAEQEGVANPRIVLMGRSLGGGVAVDLAGRHSADALVLESTFSSMPDAAARIYWWAPVKTLMQNRYDSLAKITHYEGPLLQTHCEGDSLVPLDLAYRLFDACPSDDKRFVKSKRGDHNTPPPPKYYQQLALLLDRVLAGPQAEQSPIAAD